LNGFAAAVGLHEILAAQPVPVVELPYNPMTGPHLPLLIHQELQACISANTQRAAESGEVNHKKLGETKHLRLLWLQLGAHWNEQLVGWESMKATLSAAQGYATDRGDADAASRFASAREVAELSSPVKPTGTSI
jgi:hypothetical protein